MMETKLSFSINFNSLLRSAFANSLLSVYFTLVSMNGTKQHMHLNYNNGNLLLFTLMLESKCPQAFFCIDLTTGSGVRDGHCWNGEILEVTKVPLHGESG